MVFIHSVYSSDPASIIFFQWEESGPSQTIQINQLSNASLFQEFQLLFINTYNGTPFAGLQEYTTILPRLYKHLLKSVFIIYEYLFSSDKSPAFAGIWTWVSERDSKWKGNLMGANI